MIWINILNWNPTSTHGILSTNVNPSGSNYAESFSMYTQLYSGNKRFYAQVLSASDNRWHMVYGPIPTGWVHITAVYDPSLGNDDKLKVYKNGIIYGTQHDLLSSSTYTSNTFNDMIAGRHLY